MNGLLLLAVGAVGVVIGICIVITVAVLVCDKKVKSHREWDE